MQACSTLNVVSDERQPPRDSLLMHRLVALIEVLICSDYPTQLALGATFALVGLGPYTAQGHLRLGYVVGLSLADAVVLLALILVFLRAHGERPRDVFFGHRPIAGEAAIGVPLILAAFGIGIAVLAPIQRFAPWLHTVERNPLQTLLQSPGGVREEIQRAFLLHRFDRWLGGGVIGIIVTSAMFGAGHLLQGADAVIATGLLGAFWGAIYLRRRSAVAGMVSHSGFDLLQILQFMAVGR